MATDAGFKPDLIRALSSNIPEPPWCTFRQIDDLHQFDIWIRGVGDIPLSEALSQDQANRIISKARSHYPKLWTLDSSEFRIVQQESWARWLEVVALTAANDLGVTECHAEPSSLMIVEQGVSLEPCKYVVKSSTGFATLVIGLPSEHSDGRLFFQYGKSVKSFPISSESSNYVVAWYSDVKHGFLPAVTGFRWMLTFNLITHTPPPQPSVSSARGMDGEMSRLLACWMQNPSIHQYLCHVPSFTDEVELPTNQAARDYIERLQHVCHSEGVSVFLTTMKRKISGRLSIAESDQPPQHREIASIGEEKYTLTLHITPQLEVPDLELDTGNLLVPTCFDGLAPSEEQVEEQDADMKPHGTQWYQLTAAILIPYRNLLAIIKDFTRPALVEYCIDRALADYLPPTDLWHHIKTVCKEADIQSWPERTISLAIEASLRAQDYEAFEHIASNGQNKSSCDLGVILKKAAMMRSNVSDELGLQRGLSCVLDTIDRISARYTLIKTFAQPFIRNDSSRAFFSGELMKLLAMVQDYRGLGMFDENSLDASDGAALVDLSLDHLDVGFLEFRTMPIISDPRIGPSVVLGFTQRLLERTVAHDIQHDTALGLYQKLEASRLLKLPYQELVFNKQQPSQYWRDCFLPQFSPESMWNDWYIDPGHSVPDDLLPAIFRDLDRLGWMKQASSLSHTIAQRASKFRNLELQHIWVFLLGDILENIQIDSPLLKDPGYQELFTEILEVYASRFVARKESQLTWRDLDCVENCSICEPLSAIHSQTPIPKEWEVTTDKNETHIFPKLMPDSDRFRITCTASECGQKLKIRGKRFKYVEAVWKIRQKYATHTLERVWKEEEKLKVLVGSGCYADLKKWTVQKPEEEAPWMYAWQDDPEVADEGLSNGAALVPSILARKRRLSEISRILLEEQDHA